MEKCGTVEPKATCVMEAEIEFNKFSDRLDMLKEVAINLSYGTLLQFNEDLMVISEKFDTRPQVCTGSK